MDPFHRNQDFPKYLPRKTTGIMNLKTGESDRDITDPDI